MTMTPERMNLLENEARRATDPMNSFWARRLLEVLHWCRALEKTQGALAELLEMQRNHWKEQQQWRTFTVKLLLDQGPLPTWRPYLGQFIAYGRTHPGWGCLHAIFDDGNTNLESIEFALHWREDGDPDDEAKPLLLLLLRMNEDQRTRLVRRANRFVYPDQKE